MPTFVVPSIFTAVDKISGPMQRMQQSVQRFAQKAETGIARVERVFRRLTPNVSKLGKQMLTFASAAAVSAAILGGINFSTTALKDYETNLASLQAITGVTDATFVEFKAQIVSVAKDTKKSSVEIAKAFEVVGSAKPELLANAEALAEVTRATIVLSKASREDLEPSAQALSGTLNQFNLAADQSNRVINVLAAGAQAGSAAIPLITDSLDKFGAVAAESNISLEQSVALIETLAEKQIKGAEAGTKLRSVIGKLDIAEALPKEALTILAKFGVNTSIVADKSLGLQVRLKELSKIQNDSVALTKVFGEENLLAGGIILRNVDKVNKYTESVTGTNTAAEQAALNTNTLTNRLAELSNKWVNILTTNTSANGALGAFKRLVVLVTDNLSTIVKVIGIVVGSWVAMKLIILATRGVLFAYNVVLGISTVLQGKSALALRASSVAMGAFAVASKIVTAVQWAWNAALLANPIGLIILGIAALIALIVVVVNKWDEWGAAVAIFMGPLGLVISMVQAFRRNWEGIKNAFAGGDIIGGLKKIGAVLLDSLLMPLQQLLELMSKIPGLGGLAGQGAAKILSLREGLGVVTDVAGEGSEKEPINTIAAAEQGKLDRQESIENQNLKVTIRDETGKAQVESDGNMVPVTMESTFQ